MIKKFFILVSALIGIHGNANTVSIDITNGFFNATNVNKIVKATPSECQMIDESGFGRAVWVEVFLNGYTYKECIRYYYQGLLNDSQNNRAIVYFSGDVATIYGVPKEYSQKNPQSMQNEANYWSNMLNNHPYIYLARPGIYGSSGVHNGARKPLESLLMSEALSKIKSRHQILNYVLVGHSGGGHIVASLLSKRKDILCAVPSSSPSSPKELALIQGKTIDTRLFDAVDALTTTTPKHPANRVFVVGDLNDKIVSWGAQKVLHERLIELNWSSEIINLKAVDSSKHILADEARKIAGMCSRGLPTSNILQYSQKL